MIEFRFYCLDAQGRIRSRHETAARDDREAIEFARKVEPHVNRELWQGTRKVALIPAV